jgi:hypothetical protein
MLVRSSRRALEATTHIISADKKTDAPTGRPTICFHLISVFISIVAA